ncbi:MAG: S-layer homology domain-containing protein [Oscillospiraceae bacterium]|nr:S-layer homology domain-containing protein [Oscillospiraceae bacterium]
MTFRGFVGVWSKNADGKVIYSYSHGGDINVTGNVSGFTEELSLKNYIDITPDSEVLPETLAGKHILVEHDGVGNAAYEILSASEVDEDTLRLDIGTVTTIRRYVDNKDFDKGYIYNIGKGQKFVIPMTDEQNFSPVFDSISDGTTSAGSTYKAVVSATGNDGAEVTIVGRDMPRGASFDSNTNTFSWKPDSSQVGDNHVSLTATDEFGRESVVHFTVTVYGATTGNKNEITETPSTEGSGASGGGGGGVAPSDKADDTANADEPDASGESGESEKNEGNTDNTGTESRPLRFTDLANHTWAENAINSLANNGIIKGTSENTFNPASNITRADFALLLVRAFKLTSDNAENFADVSANDYYASELAIARNTGIVNGIGDNNYAPRNTITRQDMMVIVYRVLTTLNVGFGENVEPQYADFAAVADYAKEAVSALISAGLVNGKSGNIAPEDFTTRAEVAVLIKRILDYLK